MVGKKRRSGVLVGCSVLASFAAVDAAKAVTTTLFNSNGFEPTAGYIPSGSLVGQPATATSAAQQWTGFVSADPGQTVAPTVSVQTYANTFPGAVNNNPLNTQLAEIQANGVNTDTTIEVFPQANYAPIGKTFVPTPGQDVVDVLFTMSQLTTAGEPFVGIYAYGSGGAFTNPIAQSGIDGVTGKLVGPDTFTAAGNAFAATVSPTSFYSYELQLNYVTDTATMYAAANGSALVNLGSASFTSTDFSYAAITSYGISNANYSETTLFDDYSVVAVPEPASASLVVASLAAGGALLRRRREISR